jgi:molecular chaperone GrpE
MSDMKVTDRRWWARGEESPASEEPKLKPKYVEDLEAQVADKNTEIQQLIAKYRGASEEFDQARARLRKEMSKDIERGRRALIVSFLEVLDNLDRALEAAGSRPADQFVHGVALVHQQFLATLEGFGVTRINPLGEPFDPARHEAVSTLTATSAADDGRVAGVVRPGYLMGDEVLRPAQVAVARTSGVDPGVDTRGRMV